MKNEIGGGMWHVFESGVRRRLYRVLLGKKFEVKGPLERTRSRWEDNT
jgi:hypothetical protein